MKLIIRFPNGQKMILNCAKVTIQRIIELQALHNFNDIEYIN